MRPTADQSPRFVGAMAEGIRRRLRPGHMRVACITALAVTGVLVGMAVAQAAAGQRDRTVLGADYPAFYLAGQTLNDGAAARLYDDRRFERIYFELLPDSSRDRFVAYANAPHFALIFRPLAKLPYDCSAFAWGAICFALFAAGFVLLRSALPELRRRPWGTPLLLVLSFEPLLFEATLGGQASAVGFFWLAAGLWAYRRGRPVLAGVALSMLAYKPTLLLLLPVMLLIGRQWRVLVGLAGGAVALAGVSVWALGSDCCEAYVRLLLNYGGAATSAHPMFRTFKFVDINAFFHLLMPGHYTAGMVMAAVVGIAAVAALAWHWWRFPGSPPHRRNLTWAATLAWLPVFNLYGPIYDTSMVALAMMLAAGALLPRDEADAKLPPGLYLLMLLVYVTPWWTQKLAAGIGVQAYTIVLAGVGAYLLWRGSRGEGLKDWRVQG